MQVFNEYSYRTPGAPKIQNGKLIIPDYFHGIKPSGIAERQDLIELYIEIEGLCLGANDIRDNYNLRSIEFKHEPRRDLATYVNCFNLREITIAGQTYATKVAGSGEFGYVKDERSYGNNYKIYTMTDIPGGEYTEFLFVNTVANGFEYTESVVIKSHKNFEEAVKNAMQKIHKTIQKHIAPWMFNANGEWIGEWKALDKLRRLTDSVLKNAKPGEGDQTFNLNLQDTDLSEGEIYNPHNFEKKHLEMLVELLSKGKRQNNMKIIAAYNKHNRKFGK